MGELKREPMQVKPAHHLATVFGENLERAAAALIWSMRFKLHDLTAVVSIEDLETLKASLNHNGQDVVVHIVPFHSGLTLRLMDQNGSAIVQSESTEEDLARKTRSVQDHRLIEQIPELCAMHAAAGGLDGDTAASLHAAAKAAYRALMR